tara:strand:- start:815 stop:1633 length:819 start_codon:yes stop_codon:yes gene_type:complete
LKEDILIIGCGEIGVSLITGWLNKKNDFFRKINKIYVIEKDSKRQNYLKKKYSGKIFFLENKENFNSSKKFKYVFLAFKPQDLNKKIVSYRHMFNKDTIIFSLLAGKKIADIQSFFPVNKNIIRLMLNTPISLNEGTIIYYPLKKNINKKNLFILDLLGRVLYIKNEKFFPILTAVVGSGPAFFYLLIESIEKKTISSGLPKYFTQQIIKQTFKGTSEIVNKFNHNFFELRKKVTSKGGTTESAMKYLEKKNFKKLIGLSIDEAKKKADKLA